LHDIIIIWKIIHYVWLSSWFCILLILHPPVKTSYWKCCWNKTKFVKSILWYCSRSTTWIVVHGRWCHAVWQMETNVSVECTASIFRVDPGPGSLAFAAKSNM
jgi:hypothetical protein